MANLLIGIAIGFVSGIAITVGLAETWIQKHTRLYDQGKAAFGNKRYQEGWNQGRKELAHEHDNDHVFEFCPECGNCMRCEPRTHQEK